MNVRHRVVFMPRQKKAVFVGHDTAGFLTGLGLGFKALGWSVKNIGPVHPFKYAQYPSSSSGKVTRFRARNLWRSTRAALSQLSFSDSIWGALTRFCIRRPYRMVRAVILFPYAIFMLTQADLVLYNGGMTISGTAMELRIARRLRTKIVSSFHGSDIRPAYLDGAWLSQTNASLKEIRRTVRRQFKVAQRAERFSHMLVSWSGITHFILGKIYLHEQLGFPSVLQHSIKNVQTEEISSPRAHEHIVVLHMPTNRFAKGTDLILNTLEGIRLSGQEFEVRIVERVRHDQSIREIADCDLVVDQVYSDSATGVLASEASVLGKPVVVASKDQAWLTEVLGPDLPETYFIETSMLGQELTKLIEDASVRGRAASRAAQYFQDRWNPTDVAKKYLEVLFGESPLEPYTAARLTAARGGFASPEFLRKVVSSYIKEYGHTALQLDGNPELRDSVVEEFFEAR